MNLSTRVAALLLPLAALSAALFSGPLAAADDAALKKDLTAVITLIGAPCGTVVEVRQLAADDHVVSCSNGMRYRIHVNPQGRVVADRQ